MAETDSVEILDGKVQSIMPFGAFITLKDGSVGLVHISEISENFVNDVNDYLKVGMTVKVVELPTEKRPNRKRLSIKQTGIVLKPLKETAGEESSAEKSGEHKSKKQKKKEATAPKTDFSVPPPMFDEGRERGNDDFSASLAKYMKASEERLVDIKHQTENKRGKGYIRRG